MCAFERASFVVSNPNLLERVASALADRYALEGEIGSGGMATVYLAEDRRHHRKVAIKVLHPELAQSIESERFLREIRISANLTHPHILPMHDSGEAEGLLYYVMPYVEGESLRARLDREGQLPLDDAIRITRELAGALDYAHERGVIHRDVKPGNVLLAAGHAVLADFGVALAIEDARDDRLTRTGSSPGTPAYMAPEQIAGDHDPMGRSDLYSLGCVLYEMVAGTPPFSGPTSRSVLNAHLNQPPLPVTAHRPSTPEWVEQLLDHVLAKVPADRVPTAGAFADALSAGDRLDRGGRSGRRVHAALASPVRQWSGASRRLPLPGHVVRRHPGVATGAVLLALVTVIALALGPALVDLIRGPGLVRHRDVPSWGKWELLGGVLPLGVFMVLDSALVANPYDSLYAFRDEEWTPIPLPDHMRLLPRRNESSDGFLLGVVREPRGRPVWKVMSLSDGEVREVREIPEPPPVAAWDWWWDHERLVTYDQARLYRLTGSEWRLEETGAIGPIGHLWGDRYDQRFAVAFPRSDALLVYDGISWFRQDVFLGEGAGVPRLRGGNMLGDGGVVVYGAEELEESAVPLVLTRDGDGQDWRRVPLAEVLGISTRRHVNSEAGWCFPLAFFILDAAGPSVEDFYFWGSWQSCVMVDSLPVWGREGCPEGFPCVWHVSSEGARPVQEFFDRSVTSIAHDGEMVFACLEDGTVWRRVAGHWRVVTSLPGSARQLIAAGDLFWAAWDGELLHESPNRPVQGAASHFLLPPGVLASRPPLRVVVQDSVLAVVGQDGGVSTKRCTFQKDVFGAETFGCSMWKTLEIPWGGIKDLGFLPDGTLLGVGSNGLAMAWLEGGATREPTPDEAREEDLFRVIVGADGTATAIGRRLLLNRTPTGQWETVRRLPVRSYAFLSPALGPNDLVYSRDGELITGMGGSIRYWAPGGTGGNTLPRELRGRLGKDWLVDRSTSTTLHLLPDGRLVVGFGQPDRSLAGGWLQVWAPPLGEGRSKRLDLPMMMNVTDLTDDGKNLYVAGHRRLSVLRIPLDSLPFAGEVRRK